MTKRLHSSKHPILRTGSPPSFYSFLRRGSIIPGPHSPRTGHDSAPSLLRYRGVLRLPQALDIWCTPLSTSAVWRFPQEMRGQETLRMRGPQDWDPKRKSARLRAGRHLSEPARTAVLASWLLRTPALMKLPRCGEWVIGAGKWAFSSLPASFGLAPAEHPSCTSFHAVLGR